MFLNFIIKRRCLEKILTKLLTSPLSKKLQQSLTSENMLEICWKKDSLFHFKTKLNCLFIQCLSFLNVSA